MTDTTNNIDTTLSRIIYRNYVASALIPIVVIELALLILYFSVSYFLTHKSRQILSEEAQQTLAEISKREASQIAAQFEEIDRLLMMIRNDHERFFASGNCLLPHGEPRFQVHANGAYYKQTDNGGSSVYYAATTALGPEELRKARCSEMLDPLMQSIVDTHPIVTQAYLNTEDDFNRLYPFMNDAPGQYGPDLHMADYNFFYLADPRHNPERNNIWTGAYLDPAGQGWMISDIAPIYHGNIFEGVSGLDVTIDSLVRNILSLEIPWNGSAFLVDAHGMILAMPEPIERVFGLKELKEHIYKKSVTQTIEKPEAYHLLKSPNATLRQQMIRIFADKRRIASLTIGGSHYMLAQQTIPQTQWRLMLLLDKSVMLEPTRKLKEQTDLIGFIVVSLMLFFYLAFFLYLLRKSRKVAAKIAEPIEELSQLTTGLGSHPGHLLERRAGIAEVDQLIGNFNALSTQLDARTQDYIRSQLREKMQEKDAEIAYQAGLFESASSYLHNIGNALTMLDAKIHMLRNTVTALKKSELGFRKILDMLRTDGGALKHREALETFITDFSTAMTENVTEEIEAIVQDIEKIQEHAVISIGHQQDVFNANSDAKKNYVQNFDVKEMLASLLEDYHLSFIRKGILVDFEAEDDLRVATMKFQFQNGLSNVIKNAIESIQQRSMRQQGRIAVSAYREDNRIVIVVTDNGMGVDPADIPHLLTSGFTTKAGGHGLGLHAFNNHLNANGGTIDIRSDGPMTGAAVTITIGASHAD